MKRITIEPVSRIEGHAKISIQLDDQGHVANTEFSVTQVRGFEKFTEGHPFTKCRGLRRGFAASARSATCWLQQRLATRSWRYAFLRSPGNCVNWCTTRKSCNRTL
jgi:hypothetical protein